MSRRRPDPQDIAVQLNASIPLRVKDALVEKADAEGKPVSAYLTSLLKREFNMN